MLHAIHSFRVRRSSETLYSCFEFNILFFPLGDTSLTSAPPLKWHARKSRSPDSRAWWQCRICASLPSSQPRPWFAWYVPVHVACSFPPGSKRVIDILILVPSSLTLAAIPAAHSRRVHGTSSPRRERTRHTRGETRTDVR